MPTSTKKSEPNQQTCTYLMMSDFLSSESCFTASIFKRHVIAVLLLALEILSDQQFQLQQVRLRAEYKIQSSCLAIRNNMLLGTRVTSLSATSLKNSKPSGTLWLQPGELWFETIEELSGRKWKRKHQNSESKKKEVPRWARDTFSKETQWTPTYIQQPPSCSIYRGDYYW